MTILNILNVGIMFETCYCEQEIRNYQPSPSSINTGRKTRKYTKNVNPDDPMKSSWTCAKSSVFYIKGT